MTRGSRRLPPRRRVRPVRRARLERRSASRFRARGRGHPTPGARNARPRCRRNGARSARPARYQARWRSRRQVGSRATPSDRTSRANDSRAAGLRAPAALPRERSRRVAVERLLAGIGVTPPSGRRRDRAPPTRALTRRSRDAMARAKRDRVGNYPHELRRSRWPRCSRRRGRIFSRTKSSITRGTRATSRCSSSIPATP